MKPLWSGRFKKGIHPLLKDFSYSLAVDGELLEAELRVNAAWARMLAKAGLVTPAEKKKILSGLAAVARELGGRDLRRFAVQYEDVHTLIQRQLEKKIGEPAKKIHTGRSRNDLVVTSTRVYLKDRIDEIVRSLEGVQRALVACAKKTADMTVSGMTHLRRAQPVLLAHHLLAYVEMLEEDKDRLTDARKRTDVLVLGSAALAGSSLDLDQKMVARELGFSKIAANSLAAVSDRAFLAEYLAALAILWMHLSRLAEDFVLWNSEAFRYVELSDEFATGSSLMPQKKNPDVFELLRGRSGVIFGHLQAVLTLQKGLALGYNRDLQEDKPGVFDATRKTLSALALLAAVLPAVAFNRKALEQSAEDEPIFSTDILEYLVRKGVPFSEAHQTVGRVVRFAEDQTRQLRELGLREWKNFSRHFDSDIYDLFQARVSVAAKKTIGSTNPARVCREIKRWETALRRKSA